MKRVLSNFALGAIAFVSAAVSCMAQTVFEENFENPKNAAFNGFQIGTDNPSSGKYCARITGTHNAFGKKFIAVEPDQWYRMSVRTRNDVKNGELKFGLIESRSAEKQVSQFYDWHWKGVSLNISDWRTDTMEFKTASNTHGVRLYVKSENPFTGSSWWDDIKLEKFEKKFPPLEIKPFRAAVSFTDIPTKMAYAEKNGKHCSAFNRRENITHRWETLNLANEKIEISYCDLPKNSTVKVELLRGGKILFQKTEKYSGSGSASFNIGLDKLPEGIYRFQVVFRQPGKNVFSVQKELWRISSRTVAAPKHEPVKRTCAGEGHQRLLNGKICNFSFMSMSPSWGYFGNHKKVCKPNCADYIRTLQEQFGTDLFNTGFECQSRDKKVFSDYMKKAVVEIRAYLDFLQSLNCYASVSVLVHRPKNVPPDLEAVRYLVRSLKDHPALFEWTLDEPEAHRFKPDFMKEYYRVVHEEDPNHIFRVNLCDPNTFHLYVPHTDVASHDIYPFPGSSLLESRSRVQKLLDKAPAAPYDSYLQTFNFNHLAMPSFDQLRASFLMDRIFGSHSLYAYAWADPRQSLLTDPELQSYYRAVVSMFHRLEPVLRNPAKKPVAVVSSHSFAEYATFEDGEDQILLLVNLSNDTPVDVSFSHPAEQAADFFDPAWKYPQKNGKFRFTLAPNESKVLRLSKGVK